MTTTHSVTLPDGKIAHRVSRTRTYTHAVAVGPTRREAKVATVSEEIARYTALADLREDQANSVGSGALLVESRNLQFGDRVRTNYYLGQERISHFAYGEVTKKIAVAKLSELAARYRARVALLKAANATYLAGPEFVEDECWRVESWAGSLDLAEKAAGQYRGRGQKVILIETERVSK